MLRQNYKLRTNYVLPIVTDNSLIVTKSGLSTIITRKRI